MHRIHAVSEHEKDQFFIYLLADHGSLLLHEWKVKEASLIQHSMDFTFPLFIWLSASPSIRLFSGWCASFNLCEANLSAATSSPLSGGVTRFLVTKPYAYASRCERNPQTHLYVEGIYLWWMIICGVSDVLIKERIGVNDLICCWKQRLQTKRERIFPLNANVEAEPLCGLQSLKVPGESIQSNLRPFLHRMWSPSA